MMTPNLDAGSLGFIAGLWAGAEILWRVWQGGKSGIADCLPSAEELERITEAQEILQRAHKQT